MTNDELRILNLGIAFGGLKPVVFALFGCFFGFWLIFCGFFIIMLF